MQYVYKNKIEMKQKKIKIECIVNNKEIKLMVLVSAFGEVFWGWVGGRFFFG